MNNFKTSKSGQIKITLRAITVRGCLTALSFAWRPVVALSLFIGGVMTWERIGTFVMDAPDRIRQWLNNVWFEIRWVFDRDNERNIAKLSRMVFCNEHAIHFYGVMGVAIITLVLWFGIFSAWDYCFRLAHASETWEVTAYCSCSHCCGKSDGITASGKKAQYGMVACNWLAFNTKININGLGVFTVQDRGARSLFGTSKNHIKHLDLYLPTHSLARKFGVKYLTVSINKEK